LDAIKNSTGYNRWTKILNEKDYNPFHSTKSK